jgi:hypothetical protein
MRRILAIALTFSATASTAYGDPCRRAVEIRLAPVPNVQLAVWIEDGAGRVVDTVYVTRSTGALGLANRPGNPRFKSEYRFPYGAREMVLPLWAHARGKTYPRVIMGGITGADDDDTIGYHSPISSPESFYCSPNGGIHRTLNGVDTVTCASPFLGAKGVFAAGRTSVYPPRADLTEFTDHDSPDARAFAGYNDLAVVSGATPPGGGEIVPPLRWPVPDGLPDGDYTLRVEVSLEADFSPAWPPCAEGDPGCAHPTFPDDHIDLVAYGRDALGQPSLAWSAPFTLDGTPRVATARDYQGYGDWDGATGALHPPDATIATDTRGSGAQRLIAVDEGAGPWRVKVSTGCIDMLCTAPPAPADLTLTPSDTSVEVAFTAPPGAVRPARYEVRYRTGAPLTNETFATATPGGTPPAPGPPGAPQRFTLDGLKPDREVSVGIRAIAACGAPSPVTFGKTATNSPRYATLSGCFIATAAYGSPLEREVEALRAVRDTRLYPTPLGRLAVAAYYAFSPPLAAAIAHDRRLRAAARALLAPLVGVATAAP